MLQAGEEVVNVGIADALRQHDTGENGLVGIAGKPTADVADAIGTWSLSVKWIRRSSKARWSAGLRAVNNRIYIAA